MTVALIARTGWSAGSARGEVVPLPVGGPMGPALVRLQSALPELRHLPDADRLIGNLDGLVAYYLLPEMVRGEVPAPEADGLIAKAIEILNGLRRLQAEISAGTLDGGDLPVADLDGLVVGAQRIRDDLVASAPPLPDGVPDAKARELAAAVETTLPPQVESAVLLDPFDNEGDPATIDAVMAATVHDLMTYRSSMRLSASPEEREEQVFGLAGRQERARTIAGAWSTHQAERVGREVEAALIAVLNDADYRPFTDNEFTVTAWLGVRIDAGGTRAFAVLRGHDDYYDPASGWEADIDRQWQVELVHETGGWKLARAISVTDEAAN